MSKVYMVHLGEGLSERDALGRFEHLIDSSGALSFFRPDEFVAIKIHFGEKGNTGHVDPAFMRILARSIARAKGKPFLTDTNTLYKGERMNAVDHLRLAEQHGFSLAKVGCPVIIGDGLLSRDVKVVPINGRHFKEAKLASVVRDCDVIFAVSHLTGHMVTGMGAAIKNLGMGLANRAGKLLQHSSVKPSVIDSKCVFCRACFNICPAKAISEKVKKAYIDPSVCIGCAECITACRFDAINIDWSEAGRAVSERMVEYAEAVIAAKNKRMVYFNFLNKITAECDCLAKDDPRIVRDIGILASQDPVAIDQASCDLVFKEAGNDIFKEKHPKIGWEDQLKYAEERGLGSRKYELIEV